MNELDSHLQKTSEIFKIGSVEKKLQPLKVGNKPQKSIRFYQNLKEILDFLFKLMKSDEFKYQNRTQFFKIVQLCVFFSYISFDSSHFIFDTRVLYDISNAPKSGFFKFLDGS